MQLLIEGFKNRLIQVHLHILILFVRKTRAILKIKVLGKVLIQMPVSSGTDNQSLR